MMRFPGDQMDGIMQNQNTVMGYQQSLSQQIGNMNFLDKDTKVSIA